MFKDDYNDNDDNIGDNNDIEDAFANEDDININDGSDDESEVQKSYTNYF